MRMLLLPELLENIDCTSYSDIQLEQMARSKFGRSDERVSAMRELIKRQSFSALVLSLVQETFDSLCFPGRAELLLMLAGFIHDGNRPLPANADLVALVATVLSGEKSEILGPLTLLVRAGLGDSTATVDAREILWDNVNYALRDESLTELGNGRLNSVLKSIASAIIAGKTPLPPCY